MLVYCDVCTFLDPTNSKLAADEIIHEFHILACVIILQIVVLMVDDKF